MTTLTPPTLADIEAARERIAGHAVTPINYDHVPGCTYCDPEIGSVGLSEAEAKEGIAILERLLECPQRRHIYSDSGVLHIGQHRHQRQLERSHEVC